MTMQTIIQADAIEFLQAQPAGSIDLVFGSPPYEEARLYLEGGTNMGISRKTDAWVAWLVEWWRAADRACKGLVALVVAGQTRNYRWSAGPVLLMAELHRAGFNLRNPPIFHRVGIPGSGGPDWLRADYEWIVCTTRPGKLPWSDNTAMGHPPKWAPGGEMSHRISDGTRVNQWGKTGHETGTGLVNGDKPTSKGKRPSHKTRTKSGIRNKGVVKRETFRDVERQGGRDKAASLPDGTTEYQSYVPPTLANPGNSLEGLYTAAEVAAIVGQTNDWMHHNVGGGQMGGDEFASQNEAPFPEKLAEFFVQSFCPPGGVVCDTFSGSGTTAAVAKRWQRNFIGCDLRQSQVDLGLQRLAEETPMMFV